MLSTLALDGVPAELLHQGVQQRVTQVKDYEAEKAKQRTRPTEGIHDDHITEQRRPTLLLTTTKTTLPPTTTTHYH